MARHVLGKVTGDYGHPSGPDALLDIVVDPRWLLEARTIEIDLPRHLSCAACKGAGCDICAQSGALTVRERFEPPEVLRVTLPRRDSNSDSPPVSQKSSLLLRIQGRGGLPTSPTTAMRGRLLLQVRSIGPVSECVREVPDEQVTSSSTLSRADLVDEGVPSSASGAVSAPQTLISHRATAQPNHQNSTTDSFAPETRRSISPKGAVELQPKAEKTAAQEPRSGGSTVRRRGIKWQDIAVGLLMMLVGAVLAWLLI